MLRWNADDSRPDRPVLIVPANRLPPTRSRQAHPGRAGEVDDGPEPRTCHGGSSGRAYDVWIVMPVSRIPFRAASPQLPLLGNPRAGRDLATMIGAYEYRLNLNVAASVSDGN